MENKTVKALQQEQQRSWNKKNHWRSEEDLILKKYVETHGEGNWATTSNRSGLNRSGKCCRLRWKNYLRPNIKRGDMSEEEEELIIRMHKLLGNRWSLIAGRLRGRTDNEVKNYWNTHLNKNSGYPALHSTLPGRERPVPLRKQTHPKYTRQYQDNNLYSDKTKNETGNMTREDKLKDGINSKEGDQSSSIIISATTETSYPTNTDHGFNFIYADLDHQFSPSSSWVQYYLPTMGNNATSSSTFLFDDEPFFAFMNSIILLEAAFGYTAAAAGMQSSVTMPFSSADDPHSRHF